jgi:hypothetical protein
VGLNKQSARMFMNRRRARSFAEFTLSQQSEILRFAQDDSEGLRRTVRRGARRSNFWGVTAKMVVPRPPFVTDFLTSVIDWVRREDESIC